MPKSLLKEVEKNENDSSAESSVDNSDELSTESTSDDDMEKKAKQAPSKKPSRKPFASRKIQPTQTSKETNMSGAQMTADKFPEFALEPSLVARASSTTEQTVPLTAGTSTTTKQGTSAKGSAGSAMMQFMELQLQQPDTVEEAD
jgi:hypothetical protein